MCGEAQRGSKVSSTCAHSQACLWGVHGSLETDVGSILRMSHATTSNVARYRFGQGNPGSWYHPIHVDANPFASSSLSPLFHGRIEFSFLYAHGPKDCWATGSGVGT
jgi:hypothetical protein